MRRWVLALLFVCMLAPRAHAYINARDDVDTPAANATVWITGCSGTLIAPQIVLTAGHCGSVDTTGLAEIDGTFVPTGQWWRLASPFDVRVGRDPNAADAEHSYRAIFVTQAGWADIQVIMLDRPVPASQAIPVRPLTRLTAAHSAVGFWGRQSFTVAGFGGAHAVRQIGEWRQGVFPCKTAPIIANREFFCALDHGASIEPESGDSGGPMYWTDPATRIRYVIGATQGNVQFMRLCSGPTDGPVDTSHCGTTTLPKLSLPGAGPCQRELPNTTTISAWTPWHYTATFFQGGQCWTDTRGVTRNEPNIGQWLDQVLLWAPTANDRLMPVVLQREPAPNPRLEIARYEGDEFAATLASAKLLNPHAPNVWSSPAIQPLWRWQVAGRAQPVFTTEFRGDKFARPTFNEMTLSNPSLVGYLWFNATDAPNLVPIDLYTNSVSHEVLTTWDLPATIPDATARAQWSVTRHLGYVQTTPRLIVVRPIPRPMPLPPFRKP